MSTLTLKMIPEIQQNLKNFTRHFCQEQTLKLLGVSYQQHNLCNFKESGQI